MMYLRKKRHFESKHGEYRVELRSGLKTLFQSPSIFYLYDDALTK
jgi:hypothetical protein